MWANGDFAPAIGLLVGGVSFTTFAVSPTLRHVGWWLAVVATTLGAGLFSSLFYGLGMSNLVDKWIAGDEVRRFLLVWPPVLLVSTLAAGWVGTRSLRQALLISVGAVLAGVLTGAIGLPLAPQTDFPFRC